MASYPDSNTFMAELDPQDVLVMQIITGGLVLGVVFMMFVVFVLYATNPGAIEPPAAGAPELDPMYNILTALSVVAGFAASVLGQWLYTRKMSDHEATPGFIERMRTAIIMRIAPVEGAAFLGLVTLLIVTSDPFAGELLSSYPLLWLNLLPVCIMFLVAAREFPTRERIKAKYEASIFAAGH